MSDLSFKELILQGIPSKLPEVPEWNDSVSHAPKRKEILSSEEKILAVRNALRYFDKEHHATVKARISQKILVL